ncbi:hypothetical protein [Streptomyces griseorubiginosus]
MPRAVTLRRACWQRDLPTAVTEAASPVPQVKAYAGAAELPPVAGP